MSNLVILVIVAVVLAGAFIVPALTHKDDDFTGKLTDEEAKKLQKRLERLKETPEENEEK